MTGKAVPSDQHIPTLIALYLNYGTQGKTSREQRKQAALNATSLIGGVYPLIFVIGYLLYDTSLWPISLVVIALCLYNITSPLIYTRHREIAAVWGMVFVCANMVLQTYFLGTGSGAHFYIFIVPAAVLAVLGPRYINYILAASASSIASILYCIFSFQEPALEAARNEVLQNILMTFSVVFTTIMIVSSAFVAFRDAETAEDALEAEHARSETLLSALLPEEIAARLKERPGETIADNHPQIAILFADIVGFTPRSAKMNPEEVVEFLNRIFSVFDKLAEKYGLEKIKTIGDAYMVAAGLPEPCNNPVHRVAEMALDMQAAVQNLSEELADKIEVRIGLHAGPAVAGVIGNQKPFYDVWGDTVNTASRMESFGKPGHIQVTTSVRDALKNAYTFKSRGTIDVKGIGPIKTWWLKGKPRAA